MISEMEYSHRLQRVLGDEDYNQAFAEVEMLQQLRNLTPRHIREEQSRYMQALQAAYARGLRSGSYRQDLWDPDVYRQLLRREPPVGMFEVDFDEADMEELEGGW